ncbi:MAG: hypothetical protein R2867_13320 [Caldilineaceae bacterium]
MFQHCGCNALAHLGTGRSLRDLLVFLVMGSIDLALASSLGQ